MNLENILETIRLLTIQVETDREKGTGVLIVQNGRAYVITVYHCIYGKAKSPHDVKMDNITFRFDSKVTTEEIKPLSIVSYREKIVLLEVEIARLRVEGVENLVLLDRVYYDKSYHLRGYPKGLSHGHFFEAKCKDKSLDDIGFSIEVNSLTEDTSGDDIIESVAGLSGSGVFFSENGRLYLVGLINSLATDGGLFNIIYAVKLIDLKEADIELSQYQEKKIVYSTAPKQLTSKLDKSTIIGGVIIFISLVGYWYTTSNKLVIIEENNTTNSNIEIHHDKKESNSNRETQFIRNQTNNSTIKVFQ